MSAQKKIILSLFILFHLAATIILLLPDSYIQRTALPLIRPYVDQMNFWQSWNMFSPDPGNLNLYLFARVQQSDGTTWDYWLPQLHKMNLVERYSQIRFVEYIWTVRQDSSKDFWPDLAGWIAEQDRQQTGKQPVRIRLYRTWWNVPPPPPDTSQRPTPEWHTYMFFEMRLSMSQKPG